MSDTKYAQSYDVQFISCIVTTLLQAIKDALPPGVSPLDWVRDSLDRNYADEEFTEKIMDFLDHLHGVAEANGLASWPSTKSPQED